MSSSPSMPSLAPGTGVAPTAGPSQVTASRREWLALLLLVLAALASRWHLWPGQLFSFDDVNLAYSLGGFDVRLSQPHPPGYPLFVAFLHLLHGLRFRRPESLLMAASLVGSAAALLLTARCGRRLFGPVAGLSAACLLAFHPSFWYAGLTSALRVQLAVVSLATALACRRSWTGESNWSYWSALVLGLGSGMRPELLLLLLPLWVAALVRSRRPWRERLAAAALLGGSAAVWAVPMVALSGGLSSYVAASQAYLLDQAGVTSGMFGAPARQWQATTCWLLVWTLSGVLAWPLPALLAWRREDGFGVGPDRWLFLALWFLPSLAFGLFVHVADAGQTLALVPVVCLVGGHLIARSAERMSSQASPWSTLTALLLPCSLLGLLHTVRPAAALVLSAPVLAVAGWLLCRGPVLRQRVTPLAHAAVFLLSPALFLHAVHFLTPGWYYRGEPHAGLRGQAQDVWADVHSGLYLSSLGQIRDVLAVDDLWLREVAHAIRQAPSPAVLLWHRAPVSWRKVAYYHPNQTLVMLDRAGRAPTAPPIATGWEGPNRLWTREAGQPIPIPAGARLVWLVDPNSELGTTLEREGTSTRRGPLLYQALPRPAGERAVGPYRLRQ